MAKTWLKRSRFDDQNDVFWTVFGFRISDGGGLPLLVRDLAHGPRRETFQSHLGALGRNGTELPNTITEISSTKPRRPNKNSQGSQRSWTQGANPKQNDRTKPSNQPPNNRSINQSIGRSMNQPQVKSRLATNNRSATSHIENYWQMEGQ